MPKVYTHLTQGLRCQIYALLKSKQSQAQIAKQLNIHQSTVSREISRNKSKRGYRYKYAHQKSNARRKKTVQYCSIINVETFVLVEHLLCEKQWSPEQISGRLREEYDIKISHERIYQHIWDNKKRGGELYKHLRRKSKKYNKRGNKLAGRGLIPNRIGIEHRDAVVDEKKRIGDFEIDTIVGANHKGAIVSMVDRKSKFVKLELIPDVRAESTTGAMIRSLEPIKNHVLTLTSDNGKEFSKHDKIAKDLDSKFYFANPYCSWERGLNENTNGLVRQYFPKKTDFTKLTIEAVKYVEYLLNTRPRKTLNYQTPIEVFNAITGTSINYALRS